jgi:hypothetical protein
VRLRPIEDRRRLDSCREGMMEGRSLGNDLLMIDDTGRLFREGKSVISAEVSGRQPSAGGRGWKSCTGAGCSAGSSQPAGSGCAKLPAAWGSTTSTT